MSLKDDRVRNRLIPVDLNDLIPVDSRFLMVFYLRAELVSHYGQAINLLNEPIEMFIKQIE